MTEIQTKTKDLDLPNWINPDIKELIKGFSSWDTFVKRKICDGKNKGIAEEEVKNNLAPLQEKMMWRFFSFIEKDNSRMIGEAKDIALNNVERMIPSEEKNKVPLHANYKSLCSHLTEAAKDYNMDIKKFHISMVQQCSLNIKEIVTNPNY